MIIMPIPPQLNIVRNGLVLFNDASIQTSYPKTGTLWSDLSGNNYNATLTNGPTYNSSNDGSIVFADSNDTCIIGDVLNITRTSPLTLSAWIKINTINANRFIIVKQLTSGNFTGWAFWHQALNRFNFSLVSTPTNLIEVTTNYSTINTWVNVAVTYSGSGSANNAQFYINGSAVTTNILANSLTGSISNNVNLEIGNRNATFNFNGNIANTLMYNRDLTAAEILHNFIRTKIKFGL